MKRMANYESLLVRVAQLHDAAIASGDAELAASRARFRRRMRERGWREQSVGSVSESPIALPRRWSLGLRWATVAGAVSVGLIVMWSRGQRPAAKVQVDPEPIASASTRASVATAAISLPRPDPCAKGVRAAGKEPLLDDFEDQNPLIADLENRVGLWGLFKDSDGPAAFSAIAPSLRPKPTRKNRYALHAVGGEMFNWGAAIQFSFHPACYDVSAYSGVSFSARGPGRVFVGMRELSVVPTEYGGTCKRDCYNTHQKKVDLAADWRPYVVLWSEMRQRGYGVKPLDPTHVNGLGILVQASDTPFDLWFDDFKFVSR